jgi:ER membrane protein complex subunit 6
MAPSSTSGEQDEMEFYDQNRIMHNSQAVDWARTVMGVVGGVVTGILGLTGFSGFVSFALCYLLTSIVLLLKMKFDSGLYLPGSKPITFLFSNLTGCIMEHLLFWTMFYGIVHVY